MAQCIHNSTSDLNWQQQQQQQQQEIEEQNNSSFAPISSFQLLQNGVKRHAHVHDQIEKLEFHGWPDFTATQYENFGAANVGEETISTRQASSSRSSKRKYETSPNLKSKRAKEGIAEEENTSETQQSIESLKEKSKGCSRTSEMTVKADYIHVRARRGQATDRHSLAERVRRERISERMKYLQDLVPGCSKPTGKAGMLDEIINYVQSLQRQVEFLSMKLAVVNPRLDLTIDDFFSGEINATCNSGLFQGTNMLPEQLDPSYLQLKSLQQAQDGPCCGLELAMDTPDLVLHRTISTQVPVTHTFLDSCFNVHGCSSPWDYALELHQERESTLPCQSLQGDLLPSNPKMEM